MKSKNKKMKSIEKLQTESELELIHLKQMSIPIEERDDNRYYKIIKNKITNKNYKPDYKSFNKNIYTESEKKKLRLLMLSKEFSIHRKKFWLYASGAITAMNNNKTLYYDLVNNIPEKIPSPNKKLISPDLTRTFPSEPFFQKKETIDKIERILLAYSWRNSTIGYCQGFNFIVARLLEYLGDEEETFWVFAQIIESILPVEHYAELSGVMCDCVILLPFFKTTVKNVYAHLEKLNFTICINNLLYKWFVSLFIEGMHKSIWMTIWDLMFLEGNIVLFKAALTIIHLAEQKILSAENIVEVNKFFEEQLKNFTHKDFLREMIQRDFNFDEKYIDKKRNENLHKTFENIKIANKFKIKQYQQKEAKLECNVDWPICICRLTTFNIDRCFVFRGMEDVLIKEEFYNEKENVGEIVKKEEEKEERNLKELYARKIDESVKMELYKKMIIERRVHKCKFAMRCNNMDNDIRNGGVNMNMKLDKENNFGSDEGGQSINIINSYLEEKRDFDPSKIIDNVNKSNAVLNSEDNIIKNASYVFEKMKEDEEIKEYKNIYENEEGKDNKDFYYEEEISTSMHKKEK